jgi:recombination protein RecA
MSMEGLVQQNIRERALSVTMRDLERRIGTGSVVRAGDLPPISVDVVSSGCAALDRALGVGGYPSGRVVEVFGEPGSGKTTLGLHAVVSVQQAGGTALYVDMEHALDPTYCMALGVDTDALLLCQPGSGEDALDVTESMVRSGAIDLVVIDSVAALVPQAELRGRMGDNYAGLQARLMSQAMRKLTAVAHRTGVLLLFINQVRHTSSGAFGGRMDTPGGAALKYYSAVRLELTTKELLYEHGTVVGSQLSIRVVKNKVSLPHRAVECALFFGHGLSPRESAPNEADAKSKKLCLSRN